MNDLVLDEEMFLQKLDSDLVPGVDNPVVNALTINLNPVDAIVYKHKNHIHISMNSIRHVLSSSIYHGGMGYFDNFINIKVDMTTQCQDHPKLSIERAWQDMGLEGKCFGMMTAASMNSLAIKTCEHNGLYFTTLVTTGLDNGRRVGDKADFDSTDTQYKPGTINMMTLTNLCLSDAALVEAIAMMNETKSQVLLEMNILSNVSQLPITGTGTDSCGIISDPSGRAVEYVGKHVIEGELLANSVSSALKRSLAWNKTSI